MRLGRAVAAGLAAALTLTACGLDYDEKRDYLRKVAIRGAETHSLIAASEGVPDAERCKAAHAALNDDAPEEGTAMENREWQAQVEAFFVDSCVSGKPKELPPLGPPATPAPSVSPPGGGTSEPSPPPPPSSVPSNVGGGDGDGSGG